MALATERPLTVFVSSTAADLGEHRAAACAAVRRAGGQTVAMEDFNAAPGTPLAECLARARGCDALVLILGHRYGWVPPEGGGADGVKSITRLEVEAAHAADKPVFAFLADEAAAWHAPREQDRLLEARTQKDMIAVGRAVQGLAEFKTWLRDTFLFETFSTPPGDLGGKVATALAEWLVKRLGAAPAPAPAPEDVDVDILGRYTDEVLADTEHIEVRGIVAVSGAGQASLAYPIEELYVPLRVAHGAGRGVLAAGHRDAFLADALAHARRLLVVGAPGGGKTTFLKLAACVLAKDLRDGGGRRAAQLGLPVDAPAPLPVFVRLAVLAHRMAADPNGAHEAPDRLLLRFLAERHDDATAALIERHLDEGRAALLLDGLDEVVDPTRKARVVALVGACLRRWKENLVVLTSRPYGVEDVPALHALPRAVVEDFGDAERDDFLARWVRARFPDAASKRPADYLAELRTEVAGSRRLRQMARNPVMLTCLCVVHWNERRLPEGKADLLAAVLRWLLAARDAQRVGRGFTTTFAEEAFKALAVAMTLHEQGKQAVVDLAWAADRLAAPLRRELGVRDPDLLRARGMTFLEYEALDSGVVEKVGPGELRFWHLTFQEHLAARALVERSDAERGDGAADGWWPPVRDHLCDPQWREVLDHFAGALAKTGRRRLDLLVERVLATAASDEGTEGDLVGTARAVGALGRLLRVLEAYGYTPPDDLGWAAARARAMAIFEVEGAARVPEKERIAAAEALGQAGDPRLADPEKNYLPIPGMAPLLLGTYPVTVEEFARFVEDGGYETEAFWDTEGWLLATKDGWRAPGEWEEQQVTPNRPVVRVSWHEASAYARWLSGLTGVEHRLPADAEWEAAAHSAAGRYPWGAEAPDDRRANFAPNWEPNVGAPTPVGIYPAGAGPSGHLDLAGNVWEWCSDARERGRALRGGGWFNDAGNLRSEARGWVRAGDRYDDVGFRVLLSPASR